MNFSKDISFGHLLTAGSLVIAAIGAFLAIEFKTNANEEAIKLLSENYKQLEVKIDNNYKEISSKIHLIEVTVAKEDTKLEFILDEMKVIKSLIQNNE